MLSTRRPQADPSLLDRLDPGYWDPAYDDLLTPLVHPLVPLGRFIEQIAYGPIVTGRRPPEVGAEGVLIINQGQLRFSGVDVTEATVAPAASAWDSARARLEVGDLLIARSGVGSVGRNRLAVWAEELPAVVGSFVDLVRLREIEPHFVAASLRTSFGWGQIFRIINGVGTPNISHREIAGLQVPHVPVSVQWRVHHRYDLEVLPLHRAAITHQLRLLRAGVASAQARSDPEVDLGLQQAALAYRAILDDLESYLRGARDRL